MKTAGGVSPSIRRGLIALLILVIGAALWLAFELNAPWSESSESPSAVTEAPPLTSTPQSPAPAVPLPTPQVATSSGGINFHLIRRAAIRTPSPPYGPLYQQLLPLAQSGDHPAQLRLGLLLYECRDVPADTATLDRDIEQTYQTRRRGGFDVTDPQFEDQTLRRRFQDCRDVPAAARDQYRDWIKQAADAGLLEAELELPLHLPQGEYCQYLAECSAAQRARQDALQAEAIDYMTRAREAGSAAALWTFGGWYAQGEVLPNNDIEAYANFQALDEINRAAGQPQRFAGMLKSLRARLRPADLITAQAQADALLSNPNCCVLTP